jgi:hypothetical protein
VINEPLLANAEDAVLVARLDTRLKRHEWCRSQNEGVYCLVQNRELARPLEDFSMPRIEINN